jgi:hypothetical protein
MADAQNAIAERRDTEEICYEVDSVTATEPVLPGFRVIIHRNAGVNLLNFLNKQKKCRTLYIFSEHELKRVVNPSHQEDLPLQRNVFPLQNAKMD